LELHKALATSVLTYGRDVLISCGRDKRNIRTERIVLKQH
jgi:hypothetical protein